MKIAVIGAGVSGLLAASKLHKEHDVHVFESGDHIGGQVNSLDINIGESTQRVDTGFIIFNRESYPHFASLISELKVPTQTVDATFAIRCEETQLEFDGANMRGLFDRRLSPLFPSSYQMLLQFRRFKRDIRQLALDTQNDTSLGQFLAQENYSEAFISNYVLPVASAVWPLDRNRLLELPAACLGTYFRNFGLLNFGSGSTCHTIVGGGQSYIEKLVAPFRDKVHVNTPVVSVHRNPNYVILKFNDRPKIRFDRVIVATHADTALKLLADACRDERQILSTFDYVTHNTIVHTDQSILPRRHPSTINWTYSSDSTSGRSTAVTYNLRKLFNIESEQDVLLTLHDSDRIDPAKILQHVTYRRPVFNLETRRAQRRLIAISGHRRTYYCGAYCGFGFHEDAVVSSLSVVRSINKSSERNGSPASGTPITGLPDAELPDTNMASV